MGAEEKIILINDLINNLEEIKDNENLLKDFQIYSESHGVHIKNKNGQIIKTRKIYKNVELVVPLENEVTERYVQGAELEPF